MDLGERGSSKQVCQGRRQRGAENRGSLDQRKRGPGGHGDHPSSLLGSPAHAGSIAGPLAPIGTTGPRLQVGRQLLASAAPKLDPAPGPERRSGQGGSPERCGDGEAAELASGRCQAYVEDGRHHLDLPAGHRVRHLHADPGLGEQLECGDAALRSCHGLAREEGKEAIQPGPADEDGPFFTVS